MLNLIPFEPGMEVNSVIKCIEGDNDIINSLYQTISYLQTRYQIRLHYNNFERPEKNRNDLLFKVKNSNNDIMWVYYLASKGNNYISIETEPEYLTCSDDVTKGFDKIIVRKSRQCQKMIFTSYEGIQESLDKICNSIDEYYKGK